MTDGIRLACLVSKPLKTSSVVWSKKLIITMKYTALTVYVQVVSIFNCELIAPECRQDSFVRFFWGMLTPREMRKAAKRRLPVQTELMLRP